MNRSPMTARLGQTALVVALVATVTGCSWFRSRNDYLGSEESRPLEVPPGLDAPVVDPAMTVPSVSATADSPRTTTPPPSVLESSAFALADEPASAWRRVGIALERLEGVDIVNRAEALSAYNVRFEGEEFLVRVVAAGQGSRVEAVDAGGTALNQGAATRVLGMLKARLG